MATRIEAVYENGALRPLEPLELAEHDQVVVQIKPAEPTYLTDPAYMAFLKEELDAAGPVPSLEEVRDMLAVIADNMSDVVIAARGPRDE